MNGHTRNADSALDAPSGLDTAGPRSPTRAITALTRGGLSRPGLMAGTVFIGACSGSGAVAGEAGRDHVRQRCWQIRA